MRHFDLTPLYRSTIGFDRLGSLLDTLASFEGEAPSYPPYNIERVGENDYRISMAVAGFGEGDLATALTVHAHKFSASARQKIEAAGGRVVELPWVAERHSRSRGPNPSMRNAAAKKAKA